MLKEVRVPKQTLMKPPYSKADNANDLVLDVEQAILDEPKRVWMGDWLMTGEKARDFAEGRARVYPSLSAAVPECGVIGCAAGWIVTLARADRFRMDVRGGIAWTALALLVRQPTGKDSVKTKGRLQSMHSDLLRLFSDTEVNAKYGTKQYARLVVNRIERFRRYYEPELKQRRITKAVRQRMPYTAWLP